jgi:drug/metabolite transporter (DMT)-like permease
VCVFLGDVLPEMVMLIVFATIAGFGLMVFYQPKLDPSRTALIYLFEPIIAATYAYLFAGRAMTRQAVAGAALILAANALAEWIESRKRVRLRSDAIGEAAAR